MQKQINIIIIVKDACMRYGNLSCYLIQLYCDADQFKSREIFQEDPNALQICFYYDDLEVCNPLGSKAKIHKLGCYTILYTIIHDTLSV